MEVFNDTGLCVGWIPGRIQPPAHSLTVIVKGTFSLVPGGRAALVEDEEARLPLDGERLHGDAPSASVRYESDFAYFKPRADVLVVGTCHTPRGEPLRVCHVAIQVGKLRKSLAIIGDRHWTGDAGAAPTEPQPFRSMPLRYERSFGGDGFAQNPVGKGAAKARDGAGAERWPLPNIERPGHLIASPSQAPEPAGFGPLSAAWAQRAGRTGTYDDAWLATRWPGFPEDFDWGYFNAAPADQQVEGYLKGDEALAFENLHPAHARYASALPGLRVRCFVRRAGDDGPAQREIPLRLDTLWADMDAERMALLWRGVTPIASRDHEELEKILVVAEDLALPALPADTYKLPHWWERPVEEEGGAAPQEGEEAPEGEAPTEEADAEEAEALAEVWKVLERAKVPRDILDRAAAATTPEALFAVLGPHLQHDPEAVKRLEHASRERLRTLIAEHGGDPSVVEEPVDDDDERAPEEERWTREQVEERARRGESFAHADLSDLDLSGLDLKELDFTEARMKRANLSGATLDGADLTGAHLEEANLYKASLVGAVAAEAALYRADLTGADLTRASLAGAGLRGATLCEAKLNEADLTGATLAEANLERASLGGADLSGAVLCDARLTEAQGPHARLVEADLKGVDLRGTTFDDADFTDAKLTGASFKQASLRAASFYGASGERVSMIEADLTGARLSDGACFSRGDFRGVRGDDMTWAGASIRDVDLRGATLVRASFAGADMTGGDLHRAVLKHANLGKAKLRGARLTSVNLFQGNLEGADLTRADCRMSNFYGCELLEAKLDEVMLEGTNLKATKLSGRSGGRDGQDG